MVNAVRVNWARCVTLSCVYNVPIRRNHGSGTLIDCAIDSYRKPRSMMSQLLAARCGLSPGRLRINACRATTRTCRRTAKSPTSHIAACCVTPTGGERRTAFPCTPSHFPGGGAGSGSVWHCEVPRPHYELGWAALPEHEAGSHEATVTSPQQQYCSFLHICWCAWGWREGGGVSWVGGERSWGEKSELSLCFYSSGRMFLASPHYVATKTCEGIRCKEFARQQVIDALVPPVRMHGHPFHMHYSHQQQQL